MKIIILCILILMLPLSAFSQKKSKRPTSGTISLPIGRIIPPTKKVGNLSIYYLERDNETFASTQGSLGHDNEGKEYELMVSIRSQGRKLLKTDALECLLHGQYTKPILPINGTLIIEDDTYIYEYDYWSYKSSLPGPQPIPIQFWIVFEDLLKMTSHANVKLSVGGKSYVFSKELISGLKDMVTALQE